MTKQFDILAAGELNVDMIMTGLRTMPVPGREILAPGCEVVMGSSTAICAAGLAKLGLKTVFAGKIGDDSYGKLAGDSLARYGVDMRGLIVDKNVATGITVSISSEDNRDRALVTHLGSIDSLGCGEIDKALLLSARHIHVGSFFLQSSLRPGLADMFAQARTNCATTSLDSGWDNDENWDRGIYDVLKHTDIFLPNEVEALAISGKSTVEEAARHLSRFCGICAVKCGGDGAFVCKNGETFHKPTYRARVVDTTGAGDSFNAGFIYAFLSGMAIPDCIDYGNACGTVSVTRVGGASSCASLDEVRGVIAAGSF